jgi:hypothetical protein
VSPERSISYKTVLETVHGWPPATRLTLVQDVLKTLTRETETARPKRDTLRKALGLLTTSHLPPTDEEVTRWVEERRAEKYG